MPSYNILLIVMYLIITRYLGKVEFTLLEIKAILLTRTYQKQCTKYITMCKESITYISLCEWFNYMLIQISVSFVDRQDEIKEHMWQYISIAN